MARRLGPTLVAVAALSLAGCPSVGRFPTIDPTDYAYHYFEGFYSQVYQFNAAQVESSALQALGDLGFTKINRKRLEDGEVEIKCWTKDHRPACLWVKPRNEAMTILTIYVGVVGDELVSQTVMERVSLNFGTIPRNLIPMEPTIERRFNPTPPLQPTLPKVVNIPSAGLMGVPLTAQPEIAPAPVSTPPAPAAEPGPFGPGEAPIPLPTPPAPGPGT
jgi:hypothetical protein